jgi:hypothetical protein
MFFAKIPRGVKAFRKKLPGGSPYFGFYYFFINKCFEICLKGVLYLPSPPPVCIYVYIYLFDSMISAKKTFLKTLKEFSLKQKKILFSIGCATKTYLKPKKSFFAIFLADLTQKSFFTKLSKLLELYFRTIIENSFG